MRKILLFSMLAIFALSACTKRVTKVVHEDAPNNAQGIVTPINPEDWAYDDNFSNNSVMYVSLDVPELNNEIFDHGAVMVYISFDDGIFEALPEVFDQITYYALHFPGRVDIELRSIEPGQSISAPGIEAWVKIVLIDAQAVAAHPQADLTNYAEVKKTFNLK